MRGSSLILDSVWLKHCEARQAAGDGSKLEPVAGSTGQQQIGGRGRQRNAVGGASACRVPSLGWQGAQHRDSIWVQAGATPPAGLPVR